MRTDLQILADAFSFRIKYAQKIQKCINSTGYRLMLQSCLYKHMNQAAISC
jgi:hypothetical protein